MLVSSHSVQQPRSDQPLAAVPLRQPGTQNSCLPSSDEGQSLHQAASCQDAASLATLATVTPQDEYHPLVQKGVMGLSISTLAGRGSALQISRFLNNPIVYIYRNPVGGLQGLVSAASGAVASQIAPNQTAGTVVGALAGGAAGGLQAMLTRPDLTSIVRTAAIGAVLGGAAGHVTHALRQKPEAYTLPGTIAPDNLGLRPNISE